VKASRKSRKEKGNNLLLKRQQKQNKIFTYYSDEAPRLPGNTQNKPTKPQKKKKKKKLLSFTSFLQLDRFSNYLS
jgi:hypothetical protein